jgi:hypothetical protein
MKMPISEIVDRYTITLIKSENTDEDVFEELTKYKSEIDDYLKRDNSLLHYIAELKKANLTIWNLETEAHRRFDLDANSPLSDIQFSEIGKIALEVRKWNKKRNGIKYDLVEKYCEGFGEIKINYTKTDYGKTEL